ncbi:MAG: 4Fe-4S dicluster domain-containing protein [Thermoplasmata archaeon]|nr:4Fe-4S dicluster domain-containing protein [Thermoplasmata archaeon]
MSETLTVAARLGTNRFASDKQSHLTISDPNLCRTCTLQPCIAVCPAQVYHWDGDQIRISYENCLEVGACRIACHELGRQALAWRLPRGAHGVLYRQG